MKTKVHVIIARALLLLSVVFLLISWGVPENGVFLGMDQGHLFEDAGMFALLSIAVFADAYFHAKQV
jgi:hypothetical protein